MVPQLAPAQDDPLMLQTTAVLVDPVTVALNCCWLCTPTVALEGDTVMLTSPGTKMVIVVEPDRAGFRRDVAVTVIVAGVGACAGAVYSPEEVMVPQEMPIQPFPDRLQTTMLLWGPEAEN